ncbi:MAG: FAD-binding oxidoreductase [Spirulinaceae cyanobacterium SM2_1_0]|nr:FAD-binding oxidoreductase [Spirulinaceae cyanobacterium SM2_1_0]
MYDWLIVGGGIAGAALAYELVRQGLRVQLLDRAPNASSATRYSYGGLAYWSGTSPLTRQLCQEGIAIYRQLGDELDADIEFRELDLLLTVTPTADPVQVAVDYDQLAIAPTLLSRAQACEREPQLNPAALSGALHLPHAHIHTQKTAAAYLAAYQRLGGQLVWEPVLALSRQGDRLVGVHTAQQQYRAANVAICAGGFSRALLHAAGVRLPLYFTHAEIVQIPPVDWRLRALIMPAQLQRFDLERQAAQQDDAWDHPGQELAAAILDPGAIQFGDRSLYIGQISRALTDPDAKVEPAASEAHLRAAVEDLLPALRGVPGRWQRCLVAFTAMTTPAIGAIPGLHGAHLFAGFPNSLTCTAPLARHWATQAAGVEDAVMAQVAIPPSV